MSLKLITAVLFDGAFASICLYALARGGRPERIGAGIMLAGTILPLATRMLAGEHWTQFEAATFAIDVAALAGFAWIAMPPFDRFWPTWSLGFMMSDVAVHVARAPLTWISALAYETAEAIFAYGLLVALLVGAIFAARVRHEDARSQLRRTR